MPSLPTALLDIVTALHWLAIVAWIGGLFFACLVLRPALSSLPAATREQAWQATMTRLLPWLWAGMALLFITGLAQVYAIFGSFRFAAARVHWMAAAASLMLALFLVMRFGPWRSSQRAHHRLLAAQLAIGLLTLLAINHLQER